MELTFQCRKQTINKINKVGCISVVIGVKGKNRVGEGWETWRLSALLPQMAREVFTKKVTL